VSPAARANRPEQKTTLYNIVGSPGFHCNT
jgi:hypothetical protein